MCIRQKHIASIPSSSYPSACLKVAKRGFLVREAWMRLCGYKLYCLCFMLICAHAHTALLILKFHTVTHTYKQRHNLRHTQLHQTAQMHKQIKPPSVSNTHKESSLHSYADRNLLHRPPLLFKFTGLINRFYIVNMADCVWYIVSSTHNSRLSI